MTKEQIQPPAGGQLLLLLGAFVIAGCGLVYELLAGTLSSYLLGDSVTQFSLVIGMFMASMGVGSYLSRFITSQLAASFIALQVLLGIIGGFSALLLFAVFAQAEHYALVLFLVCASIGILIGLEIPLIIRLSKQYVGLRLNVSNVLTADYLGALLVSVLFPLLLVPYLDLQRTALLFGALNIAVAALALYVFHRHVAAKNLLVGLIMLASAAIVSGWWMSGQIMSLLESRLYSGETLYSETTPYQRINLTRDSGVISLYLNGALQFSTLDEYRYHETLVHPAASLTRNLDHVLILGGGDGLALRELRKHQRLKRVTLVDIDPAITRLFSQNPLLTDLNRGSLTAPNTEIINTDAWKFLKQSSDVYDLVVIDLPDPNSISLSKLYSKEFYALIATRLAFGGILVTQATSPLYAPDAFWCINRTLDSTPFDLNETLHTLPMHAYIPTFGEWGFILAAKRPLQLREIKISDTELRFLDKDILPTLTAFPTDMKNRATTVNTLNDHALQRYYNDGWNAWYRP